MSKRPWSVFIALAMLVVIIGAACSFGATATPPPAPTQEPPTATEPPTLEPVPTEEAAPQPAAASAFEVDTTLYEHPSGTFSFYPPLGWVPDESQSGVLFSSPDNKAAINYSVVNTGYPLDLESFQNAVAAREQNFFGGFDAYQQVTSNYDEETQSVYVEKTLDFSGVPQSVFTFYMLDGQAIFQLDFWADQDIAADYSQTYLDMLDYANTDAGPASDLPVYDLVYTFTGPNDLFQFDVPANWPYTQDIDQDGTIYDTFLSPDSHGLIQNITYDDGTEITKTVAGKVALYLLNQFYTNGAGDIKVTADVVQSDGSERLDWVSKQGGYSGTSFFETRGGTTFLMLTMAADDGYEEVYGPVFDYTLQTYAVP